MNLIPFSRIDTWADEEELAQYTPGQLEAAALLNHIDWEGGFISIMYSDGVDVYPPELQDLAQKALSAYEALNEAVVNWAEERGVSY